MPYQVWVTRRFMEENINGRDYETSEIEHFEHETIDGLLNDVANTVRFREVSYPQNHLGFEFSNIYHTGQGQSITLERLQDTPWWVEADMIEAAQKEEQERAHREMLRKSEAHKTELERKEYERLKQLFEPSTPE